MQKTYKIKYTDKTHTHSEKKCEILFATDAVEAQQQFRDKEWFLPSTIIINDIELIN